MSRINRAIAKVWDGLDQVVRILVRAAEFAVVVIAFFITAAMILSVFFRFVLNSSISWTDEVTSLLLSVMMFLVIGVGMHERIHIGLSALIDSIPITARRRLDIALHIVALGFFILIGLAGLRVASSGMALTLATIPVSRGVFQFAAPIGCGFAALVCLNNILKVARGVDVPRGQRGD